MNGYNGWYYNIDFLFGRTSYSKSKESLTRKVDWDIWIRNYNFIIHGEETDGHGQIELGGVLKAKGSWNKCDDNFRYEIRQKLLGPQRWSWNNFAEVEIIDVKFEKNSCLPLLTVRV